MATPPLYLIDLAVNVENGALYLSDSSDFGALGCWAVLSVASGWLLPEAGFAITWPLIFRLATTALAWRIPWPAAAMVFADLGTLPAFTIVGAGAYSMLASLDVSGIATAIIVALCVPSAILPQICRLLRWKPVRAQYSGWPTQSSAGVDD